MMLNDSAVDYYLKATSDIPQHLSNIEYRLDMLIFIFLCVVGLGSAALVFYLLYRFILRFM